MNKVAIVFIQESSKQNLIKQCEIANVEYETFDNISQVNIIHENLVVLFGEKDKSNLVIHNRDNAKNIVIDHKSIFNIMVF